MEKINIVLQENVTNFLHELVFNLFENQYFSNEESAVHYVKKIYDFIEFKLSLHTYRNTPEKLIKFGSKYTFYKINRHTTWYIFFESFENRYLITYITNNHSEIINLL